MNRSSVPLVLAAVASLIVVAGAVAADFRFQRESMGAFQRQLTAGQLHAASFNKKAHTLHLSLNDHRHMLVSYPSRQYRQVRAWLLAAHIPVLVAHNASVAAKPVKHTLRYIAGGALILVILVVVVVLLTSRRRVLMAAAPVDGPGESAPPPEERT